MSTGLPPTNFISFERIFEQIIDIRDGANGLPSDAGAKRKTIIFEDNSRISAQEFIKNGKIDYYQYDFYDSKHNIMFKIHSESHPDKKDQTITEPYHLHVKSDVNDLKASKRLPSGFMGKDLFSMIEVYLFSWHLKPVYATPLNENEKKSTKRNQRRDR